MVSLVQMVTILLFLGEGSARYLLVRLKEEKEDMGAERRSSPLRNDERRDWLRPAQSVSASKILKSRLLKGHRSGPAYKSGRLGGRKSFSGAEKELPGGKGGPRRFVDAQGNVKYKFQARVMDEAAYRRFIKSRREARQQISRATTSKRRPKSFLDSHGVRRVVMSDMIMDESQYQALVGGGEEKAKAVRGFRNGIPVPLKHWDEGIVPYVFDGSVDKKLKKEILERYHAVNRLLESCIKIRPYKARVDGVEKVVISNRGDGSCSADIGVVRGKEQNDVRVSDADWCAIHEMFHAIGFAHEHTRPDRDQYIVINWKNLGNNELHDYQKFKGSKTYQEPYDYYSIMHYRPEFNQYTFKRGVDEFFMQRSLLPSRTDLRKVRKMYGCPLPFVTCDVPGYSEVSPGLCAKVHLEGKLPFRRAVELCQQEGGRIYEPRDVKGFLELRTMLKKQAGESERSFWIGGTDILQEGQPRYLSDGLRMAFPTSTEQPSNAKKRNCMSLDFSPKQFEFASCGKSMKSFICELPERLGGFDIWGKADVK